MTDPKRKQAILEETPTEITHGGIVGQEENS